jgi:hypothetical protein
MISQFASGESSVRLTPMEHRWGVRVGLDAPVLLVHGAGTETFGRILNASISGALIETPLALPVHATLNVQFRNFELAACVTRTEHGRLGVEWRDMGCKPLVDFLHEAQRDAALWARDVAFG